MKWYHIEFAREHNGEPDYVCCECKSEDDALELLRDEMRAETSDMRTYPPDMLTESELDDYYHVTRAYVSHTRIWPV